MTYASRRSSYIMGSLGATIQILAGWWDVYSHILFPGVDPWWNPAHLTLYTGIAIMIIAVWCGLRARPAQPTPAMVPIKFMNTAGLRLAAVGTVIEIVAGVWNEIVHRVVQSEPRIAPAHAPRGGHDDGSLWDGDWVNHRAWNDQAGVHSRRPCNGGRRYSV